MCKIKKCSSFLTVVNIVENVLFDLKMTGEALLHITCTESVVQPNSFSIVVNYTSRTDTELLAIDYNTSVDIGLGLSLYFLWPMPTL